MSRPRLIALVLALATLAVYLPVARHGFILYDDGDYVTENQMVQDGWTLAGVKWAFTTFHSANWHPLTWLSHMTDCELFGLDAAGPHCVNALLHAANTVLVFFLWVRLTRNISQGKSKTVSHFGESPFPESLWPAAFIAALFAVHPLHVESVAWVSERKDVLSTFFGLLALLCYAAYVGRCEFVGQSLGDSAEKSSPSSAVAWLWRDRPRPSPPREGELPADGSKQRVAALVHDPTASKKKRKGDIQEAAAAKEGSLFYWLALIFFACGLMSKPMLVTLPFVMLLLDYWPLGRFGGWSLAYPPSLRYGAAGARGSVGIVVEKIPFFALTIASCVVTYLAQNRGAVKSLAAVPLGYRLENAPVAVAMYLFKMIWPARLAVIYPMPSFIPPAAFGISLAILIFITIAVWLARKGNPFLMVGCLWFLGTLVPVLGLVKVGDAAMADRYTYVPSIGILMAVGFGAERIWRHFSLPRSFVTVAAIVILGALTVVTERQLWFWRSDEALFLHAMQVTKDNVDAIINYGVALENEGDPMAAMIQYRRAETLAPSSYMARVDLGNVLYYTGRTNEALSQFQEAVMLKPDSSALHDRLGAILTAAGRYAEATNELGEAIRLAPSDASPHLHLGTALAQKDFAAATNEFAEAMRLAPNNPSALVEWSKALLRQGLDREAVAKLQEALQLDPENFQTMTFAARVLASDESLGIRDGAAALALAQKADALTGGAQPLVKDVLGMAYAETGQFEDAQKAAGDAIRLATAAGMPAGTVAAMGERWQLYQEHRPWREPFK